MAADDEWGGWMTTLAAARRLGLTTRTLYRFIDSGALEAYRFGRVIRCRRADVDAYIERCRIRPGDLGQVLLGPESGDAADIDRP